MFRKVSQHSGLFTDLKKCDAHPWDPCLHFIDQCGVLSQPVVSAELHRQVPRRLL